MKLNDIPHSDAAQIDLFAWQSIKNWPKAAGFEPVHENLDFEALTRWFLWSKVGRAIRAQTDHTGFALEEKIFMSQDFFTPSKQKANRANKTIHSIPQALVSGLKKITSASRQDSVQKPAAGTSRSESSPSFFIPYPSARLERLAYALIKRQHKISISKETDLPGYSGSSCCAGVVAKDYDKTFAGRLHNAVITGLLEQGIHLRPYDAKLLKEQIIDQLEEIEKAAAELEMSTPGALLLHGDNHSPYQEYAAVARRMGIPSITFQHGLDCERYYLDDVFASAIAVWSKQRMKRYEEHAERQPSLLQVTGNPAFDQIRNLPDKIDSDGDYFLWITRPHTSSFCYSPSRKPKEGLAILDALLDALVSIPRLKLVIKPHPQDYDSLLVGRIAERGLSDKARVVKEDLNSLIAKAKVVITEDSSGGLDAMLQGKILVHAHFAESDPVLPFCRYNAALPGFSGQQLTASLHASLQLTASELEEMLSGQRRFINDFAGELDGMAETRMVSFCEDVLAKSSSGGGACCSL